MGINEILYSEFKCTICRRDLRSVNAYYDVKASKVEKTGQTSPERNYVCNVCWNYRAMNALKLDLKPSKNIPV